MRRRRTAFPPSLPTLILLITIIKRKGADTDKEVKRVSLLCVLLLVCCTSRNKTPTDPHVKRYSTTTTMRRRVNEKKVGLLCMPWQPNHLYLLNRQTVWYWYGRSFLQRLVSLRVAQALSSRRTGGCEGWSKGLASSNKKSKSLLKTSEWQVTSPFESK